MLEDGYEYYGSLFDELDKKEKDDKKVFDDVSVKAHKHTKEDDLLTIKHGHWIEESIEDEWGKLPSIWHCSECDNLELNNSSYCPNCGAKMDEEKDDNA